MKSRFLFLIVLIALLIRLMPTLITNQPFSTDTWPLIRLSEALLADPQCRIWNDSLLGGYHNRWPAVILESTLYVVLTDLELAYFFRFVGVIVTQTSVLITTYALIRRYRGTHPALLGILTLTSIPSLVIFTSTTLKEVYAYPLALLFVLIATRDSLIPAFLVAISLVASHPLTPLMMIAFLGSYLLVTWMKLLEGSLRKESTKKCLFMFSLLSSTYATYMVFYGWGGLIFKLSLNDFLTIFVIGVAVYGWYMLVGGDFIKSLPVLAPGVIAILASNPKFLEFPAILLYVVPFIALLSLHMRGGGSRSDGVLVVSLLLPILVGTQYVAIMSPLLMTILHRLLNYLFFVAIAITASLNIRHEKTRKYVIIALVTSLIITASLLINITFYGDSITYYWKYRDHEVVGISRLIEHISDEKVCGDVKIKYLVSNAVVVDPLCGIRLTKTDLGRPTILYSDNFRFGYVLSPIDIHPVQELSTLSLIKDLVYSDGVVYVVR